MSNYPRTEPDGGPYRNDKAWGIAIVALSVLGVCGGVFGTIVGAGVGLFGATAAASSSPNDGGAALAAGGIGGLIALLGIGIALCSLVQVAGGLGVMQGRRWGFVLTAVLSAISLLLNVPSLPAGLFGVAASAAFLFYCYQRLSGKEGPMPV